MAGDTAITIKGNFTGEPGCRAADR